MPGVLFALLAATGWGVAAVLNRKGLEHLKPTLGTFISLISSFSLVFVLTLVFNRAELLAVSGVAVGWFFLIGLVNFPLGRFFNLSSIQKIGVARATPIFASSPMVAVAIAVIFTGEKISLLLICGVISIMGGLYLIIGER